jgi:hypothetical protein
MKNCGAAPKAQAARMLIFRLLGYECRGRGGTKERKSGGA